jgi:hypothetical protein
LSAHQQADAAVYPRQRSYRAVKARRGAKPAALGAIGALALYAARHPVVLLQGAAGLATVLAGVYFVSHVDTGKPLRKQAELPAHPQSVPVPPPPPPAAPARPEARVEAHPAPVVADTHAADEEAKPVKRSAPARLIVAPRDAALDAWFIKAYLRCWTSPPAPSSGEKYGAQIRVVHNLDGSLAGKPVLVNPPSDPAWRPFAESAVRAVSKCNPLQVPPRYQPHFEQWKKMTLHFSPDSAAE